MGKFTFAVKFAATKPLKSIFS